MLVFMTVIIFLFSDNDSDRNFKCSQSDTKDELTILITWNPTDNCSQNDVSWTAAVLWDSSRTVFGTDTSTTDGSYTIRDVMPYTKYSISLLSGGKQIGSCSITSKQTSENYFYAHKAVPQY